jgi:hypothetical protein
MKRKEEQVYSDLQDAKYRLQQALEDIKRFDAELRGCTTFNSEVRPIIEEVFPGEI